MSSYYLNLLNLSHSSACILLIPSSLSLCATSWLKISWPTPSNMFHSDLLCEVFVYISFKCHYSKTSLLETKTDPIWLRIYRFHFVQYPA